MKRLAHNTIIAVVICLALLLASCSTQSQAKGGDSCSDCKTQGTSDKSASGSCCTNHDSNEKNDMTKEARVPVQENIKTIYLAGGCFWGVEGYFKKLDGVIGTTTGYANGKSEDTSYHEISNTDHAETVKIEYDMSVISLEEILLHYFRIIDPKSVNRQGNDIGRQYRTGIYYRDDYEKRIVEKILDFQKTKLGEIAVESALISNFVVAEDYHQDYLDKNPGGYCHINLAMADEPLFETNAAVPNKDELKNKLTQEEYNIIVNSGTERPFSSDLNNEHRRGIYVDKVTGVPLFASQDKFDAGCGWPSFSKPILTGAVKELEDNSHGMRRTEVRSQNSDAHLGHVFNDGPKEMGGLRYCINGASLLFIPYEEMKEKGYEEYMPLCE